MDNRETTTTILLTCIMLFISITTTKADANISNATVQSLVITNSARANAMGGCSVNLVDEHSPLYNPGSLGLFHLNKIFSASLPIKTKWLPDMFSDVRLRSAGISAGLSFGLFAPSISKPNFSLGLAYSQHKFDYGLTPMGLQDYKHSTETADIFSAGIGIEYYGRLGIGFSYKEITSDLLAAKAEVNANDYGLIAELPLHNIFPIQLNQSVENPIKVKITPSFAYVIANDGDSVVYIDPAEADPLPKIRRTGFSIFAAVGTNTVDYVSARFAYEIQRWEIGDPEKIYKRGFEIGLLEILLIRLGRYTDPAGESRLTTWGFGFDMKGLFKRGYILGKTGNGPVNYIAEHSSLAFDFARYIGDDSPWDGTAFINLGLSF